MYQRIRKYDPTSSSQFALCLLISPKIIFSFLSSLPFPLLPSPLLSIALLLSRLLVLLLTHRLDYPASPSHPPSLPFPFRLYTAMFSFFISSSRSSSSSNIR